MTRIRLSNRHAHESRDIEFDGRRFSLGVGFDDTGAPAEVFVTAPRAGSGYAALAYPTSAGRDVWHCLECLDAYGRA